MNEANLGFGGYILWHLSYFTSATISGTDSKPLLDSSPHRCWGIPEIGGLDAFEITGMSVPRILHAGRADGAELMASWSVKCGNWHVRWHESL